MKGKYVNTVIWMAARSGRNTSTKTIATETIASLQSHRIIWMKGTETNKLRPAKTLTPAY